MLSLEMSTVISAADHSRRARKKRDKEARIRRAALSLFRERGFEATTTREVARRAGIAAGTLFLYVESKAELIDFVFAGEIARVVDEAFATLPARGDVVRRLMHPFARLIDFYAADLTIARLLVRDAFLPAPGARSLPLTMAFMQRLAALIGAAQSAGALGDDVPALELGTHAFLLYIGAVLGVINNVTAPADAKRMLERALAIHLRGLRPPPAPGRKKP
jgi:AcrR family transcriptional regulator